MLSTSDTAKKMRETEREAGRRVDEKETQGDEERWEGEGERWGRDQQKDRGGGKDAEREKCENKRSKETQKQ